MHNLPLVLRHVTREPTLFPSQAVDLVEWREVAVKVHQLNPQWNEHKRESYVKHAVRPLHRPWISPLCAMAESSLCFLMNLASWIWHAYWLLIRSMHRDKPSAYGIRLGSACSVIPTQQYEAAVVD